MTRAERFGLGVDVGGTFTDFVLLDPSTGALHREKCLTTPQDPILGIMEGINKLVAAGLCKPEDIGVVAHATTLITNTLIERKGARTGLLCTEGFRDLLELGSDERYDMYDLGIEFPAPLVDRINRLGIDERVSAEGESLRKPDPAQVIEQVRALLAQDVQSVAVCFLHSYRNPAHERAVLEVIEREFPDLAVSVSSTVAPEMREYERTVTVAANAYVKPIVASYLDRFSDALAQARVFAPILVMLSNGGMTTPRTASTVPIRAVESGPAAGVLSACHSGAGLGIRNLVAFDMGGTTAKACFIDDGEPAFTGTFEAGRVKRQFRGSGLPLRVPSIEMIEIGAGGGSMAHLDSTGLLKVGPQSAGAQPGPVCYGRGGRHATVTDADLLLGYLEPAHFLGGDMQLDMPATIAAFDTLAVQSALTPIQAAAGIVEVVNQNMATAIRIHAAERGKDHRRYALFAFGGAGPVHAYEVARILGMLQIIYPLGAGTNSAFGLLAAPVAVDLARSYNTALNKIDWDYLNVLYKETEQEAHQMMRDAGIDDPVLVRSADMRFLGQGFELLVKIPDGELGPHSVHAMVQAFQHEYAKIYRTMPDHVAVEAVTWRLRASGPLPVLKAAASTRAAKAGAPARASHRDVWFPEHKDFIRTQVIDRYSLKPGDVVQGPAVLEERESTVVFGPRARALVQTSLDLVADMLPAENNPTTGEPK